MPMPGTGEMLLKVRYLSLDPYMRGRMDDRKSYAEPTAPGAVMPGESAASVLESNHPDYAAGDTVLAFTGWRTQQFQTAHEPGEWTLAPVITRLGVLGMPGFTAYSGLKVIGKPAEGETVVVAAASGPAGSLVGQLARIAGARAVAIAGGSAKCEFVKQELGFDDAIDHRAADFPALLAAACPRGIDVYFESVGGSVWDAVLPLLNKFARVPLCGLIAQYGGGPAPSKVDDLVSKGFLSDNVFRAKLESTLELTDVDLSQYDAVHVAGGRGATFDLYPNTECRQSAGSLLGGRQSGGRHLSRSDRARKYSGSSEGPLCYRVHAGGRSLSCRRCSAADS